MKILVTGCAGFIGFHLAKRLLAGGHEVVGVDNLNSYYDPALKISRLEQLGINTDSIGSNDCVKNPQAKFTFLKADIESPVLYEAYLNKMQFDVICHLAGQAGVRYSIDNPQQYISSNIQGFFNMLEYCRHHLPKRLVFASSSSVYGKNSKVPYVETDNTDMPVSLYAATKKSNELLAHSYSELYGLNTIGLRFFTVYGPWGRPDMAPLLFTKSIMEGKPINVFNNGNMLRDFTYVDDIVEGVYRVLMNEPNVDKLERFRIYNIGNSSPVNLNDFVATVERLTEKRAQKNYLPMQPGDVVATWADTSLLNHHYGYAPNTSVEKGLGQLVEWYKEYYA